MQTASQGATYFFVDESGDSTFFDRKGNRIVGTEGCSPILILGFIETSDPSSIRHALRAVAADIENDPYFEGIPSIKKSLQSFHAKNDVPEVRERVYRQLAKLDFKAQFIVARKIEAIFQRKFSGKPEKFYDGLISHLFKNVLHRSETNHIYFAVRGSRKRQEPLEKAIQHGIAAFEQKWDTSVDTAVHVYPQSPVGEPCLSVIDYMNWAVWRAFVRKEMRFFNVIRNKVSLVVDLYDTQNYQGSKNYYSRSNPLDAKKISPL